MKSFEELQSAYREGQLTQLTNQVSHDRLSEFPQDQLCFIENLSVNDKCVGEKVLKNRQWARLILNGGMATRFGGQVKGICDVYDGKTFLQLKLEHMNRLEKQLNIDEIPVALMNSHATDAATNDFLKKHDYFGREQLVTFKQRDFPRLTPEGRLFHSPDHKDRAPCGHGDFIEALINNSVADRWTQLGVTHFDFSNIDNLGATVELDMVGAFAVSGKDMAIELAQKNPGDQGGAAGLKDGIAGVIEGIYFDRVFDQDRLKWFNTNNLMFCLESVKKIYSDSSFSLPWNVVSKKVDGDNIIQFERIAIDTVFGFNRTPQDHNVLFFAVPREGPRGRFYPVKSPKDLVHLKDKLKERLG